MESPNTSKGKERMLHYLAAVQTEREQLSDALRQTCSANSNQPHYASESASVDASASVGAFSVIQDGTRVGIDTQIGSHVILGKNVTVGDGCKLADGCVVHDNVSMGDGNSIESYAVVGGIPQDRTRGEDDGNVIMGNGNSLHEFAVVHNGTHGHDTCIGNNNIIMSENHIAHDTEIGDNNVFVIGTKIAGHCKVGSNITMHPFCGVMPLISIGDGVFCKASSEVRQHIPPWCIALGQDKDFRVVGPNTYVLKKLKWTEEQIAQFKRVFCRTLKHKEDIDTVRNENQDAFLASFFAFLKEHEGEYATTRSA